MASNPLQTDEGVFFLRSPRVFVQWLAEWLLIVGSRCLYAAWHLYVRADRPERAERIEAAIRAGAEAEQKLG